MKQLGGYCCCQKVGLHHIVDIGEIARVTAVAIDKGLAMINEGAHPQRNHCCIGSIGVLPPAENIEITQPDSFYPIE